MGEEQCQHSKDIPGLQFCGEEAGSPECPAGAQEGGQGEGKHFLPHVSPTDCFCTSSPGPPIYGPWPSKIDCKFGNIILYGLQLLILKIEKRWKMLPRSKSKKKEQRTRERKREQKVNEDSDKEARPKAQERADDPIHTHCPDFSAKEEEDRKINQQGQRQKGGGEEEVEGLLENVGMGSGNPGNLRKSAIVLGEEYNRGGCEQTKRQQDKITKYFPVIITGSSVLNNTTWVLERDGEKGRDRQEEESVRELRQLLNAKEQEVSKYRAQKEIMEDRYSRLYLESRSYRNKSREVILQVLKEQAGRRREEKGRIDSRLGYYSGDMKHFREGEEVMGLREVVAEKSEEIERLEADLRRLKTDEHRSRIKFSVDFLKKEVKEKKRRLEEKEKEQQVYKERLKLAHKEQSCEYALHGWPLIKDSQANDRYQPMELLGKGGFGEVYKCFDLEENEVVAIKMNKIGLDYGQEVAENMLKHVLREVNTQKELKHPNIARIKELLELDRKRILFVLEYCRGPELSVYLKKHGSVEEKEARGIVYQILAALNYLFGLERKVIHYDLKPSNIIFHHGVVKLLDFGLCKLMDREESRMDLTSQGVGTYWYLPPETFSEFQSKISSKVDVWSVGVIFFELLFGRRPFANGISQNAILQRNLIQVEAQKLVFPDTNPNAHRVSKDTKQFISQCLVYDPDDRLSPSEAFTHPYFKEYHPK